MSTAIVWFRRDLRLVDNAALSEAVANATHVIPVFIHAPEEEAPWQPGAASNWWLHHSLAALDQQLAAAGTPLIVRAGDSVAELERLIAETGADAVYWSRLYEPAIIERDQRVRAALAARAIATHDFNAALLFEPGEITNKSGAPYKVFTPFWRAALHQLQLHAPRPAPGKIAGVAGLDSLPLEELKLLPSIPWDKGLHAAWRPGEENGLAQLQKFVDSCVGQYQEDRNRPDLRGTSRLSPHLHFGEISPRQVAWVAQQAAADSAAIDQGVEVFLSEIGWREFAHHLLVHFPYTLDRPLREGFNRFPWRTGEGEDFAAWCTGQTGIPLIDAGMRELWHTGWMHNRVRMVVASFLTKNQLISWQAGARWFWDTLVDADLASNTLGWQWTAGCGADAAPFFRIFNPVRQGEKFDADETYIRRWCPELKNVPHGAGHAPWTADGTLAEPIVDLALSRKVALEAFRQLKEPPPDK
jgi:deoxyribodipyrimidine photo-lyase